MLPEISLFISPTFSSVYYRTFVVFPRIFNP